MSNNFIDQFYVPIAGTLGAVVKAKTETGSIRYLRAATEADIVDSFVNGTPLWMRHHSRRNPEDWYSVPADDFEDVFGDGWTVTYFSMTQVTITDYPATPIELDRSSR